MTTSLRSRPRIAVFSGATATIANNEPLVTSNLARQNYGLPLRTNPDGSPMRFDVLRPQRLAKPVTVYVEQFTALPLEVDAAELYAPPDGYLDKEGMFHTELQSPTDVPVYEVTLRPEHGLYPLPYMARKADGQPWEYDGVSLFAPEELSRQPFFPDGSRLFEEIDRFGIGDDGVGNLLSSKADFDFYRAAPPGGFKKGLPASKRTDVGESDIPPEVLGEDFFPYRPRHLRREPSFVVLAQLTNMVQRAMASGKYAGAIWLEGSPNLEDTAYWLNLLIDTAVPICGNASQRAHGSVGNDGDRNIVDSVNYLLSGIWKGEDGRNSVGVVVIQDEQVFFARELQKAGARPGGYTATGGQGGVIGTVGHAGPNLSFRPAKRHTYTSAVNLSRLPDSVEGVRAVNGRIETVRVQVKDERGDLLAGGIPKVTMAKFNRYITETASTSPEAEVEILARIEKNLRDAPLAGLVAEGGVPYGQVGPSLEAALERAVFSGMPVVKTNRGNAEDVVPSQGPRSVYIAGSNLTASKARLLLMACLMRFGTVPPAADPARPTDAEREAIREKLRRYQEVFDTH